MRDVLEQVREHINEIQFTNKPKHVSYKYRTIFQISKIVLIIGMSSTVKGCSILKIQIISAALDDEKLFDQLDCLVNKNGYGLINSWRFNPLITTAIRYSNAEEITHISSTGKILLTEKGRNIYEELMGDQLLMSYEKKQLMKLKKKFSDSKMMTILGKGNRI